MGFPWFPLGYAVPGGNIGRLTQEGAGYQIVAAQGADQVILVLESGSLVSEGARTLLDPARDGFGNFEFTGRSYWSRSFEKDHEPITIADWPKVKGLPTSSDASALGEAIRRLRLAFPKADVSGALFLSAFGECLPVIELAASQDLRPLAVEVLAAGAKVPSIDAESIRAINSWLTPDEIEAFLAALEIDSTQGKIYAAPAIDPASFSLPGRPELERFFREYILEPNLDPDRYATLGVKTPNGVLLYGPPGSGKSYAVGKLKSALNWPVFELNLGAIGSPFIHQTAVALRKAFDEAKRKAPALIVLEEIDAIAGTRGPMMHDHKIEEVAELLRHVEAASDNKVLVIATTNRREALDHAILRKGRFDHAIEVGYPNRDEVQAAIGAILRDRPHQEIPNIEQLANKLAGRPMGDVAWVVNEAARIAARAKKNAIDEIDLFSALKRLGTA